MGLRTGTALILLLAAAAPAALARQTPSAPNPARDATRERLRALLDTAGKRADVDVTFQQSTKQPYNFIGTMTSGLANLDSIEIVVSVTAHETVGFRVYPHYQKSYINIDKVKDGPGLMRKLLHLSDLNFLFWGTDDTGDVFSGYTFTLESGFPDQAIIVVLRSIRNADGFVGEMRPFIDGSAAPAK